MNFINPPDNRSQGITHKTFFSKSFNHEVGYNVYLPADYDNSSAQYPVHYHLHGWKGNESSELYAMEKTYKNKQTITVFPNNSPVIEDFENLPVESMIINELIPLIDNEYRTIATRESRSITGFSMGGGMAFCYAVKYPELFSSVTAYAGTYHHYFRSGIPTVHEPAEKAAELYNEMLKNKAHLEEGDILCLLRQNAEKIRGELDINIHVGTNDVLICENEIMRMDLESLRIPHKYKKFYGVGHELDKIVLKEQKSKSNIKMLKHKGTVTLETQRLILRRLKINDREQLYNNCWSAPEVWKWSSYEPMDSIDDVVTLNNIFTDFWFAKYEKLDYYDWAMQLKSSGEVIGRIRGIKPDENISQIELAYELGQNWWNKGLTTEAVNALISFFMEEVGFNRIYAAHAHENPASGKVMQKCGMIYEGTARQMAKCNNGVFDMVNYAILASDYFNNKPINTTAIGLL